MPPGRIDDIANGANARPNPLQRIGYLCGRPLPETMRDWVYHDVAGPGHMRRYIIRGLIPLLPILVAFSFVPGAVVYRVAMMMLLLIPLLYFQFALVQVYRRHLLTTNGIDASALQTKAREKASAKRDEYERIYRDT